MYRVYAVLDSSYAFTGGARQASFGVEAERDSVTRRFKYAV